MAVQETLVEWMAGRTTRSIYCALDHPVEECELRPTCFGDSGVRVNRVALAIVEALRRQKLSSPIGDLMFLSTLTVAVIYLYILTNSPYTRLNHDNFIK